MEEATATEDKKRRHMRDGVDESLIIEGSRKRKRGEGSPDSESKPLHYGSRTTRGAESSPAASLATTPAAFEEVRKKGMIMWEKLTSLMDPTSQGRLSHLDFMRLPSKRDYPDYYETIKKPIAFSEIQHKLDRLEYASIAEIRNDFNQCFVNAKRYNAPQSEIFLHAKRLHKKLKETWSIITGEAVAPEEDEEAAAPLPKSPSLSLPPPAIVATPSPAPLTPAFAKRGPTLKPWLMKKAQEFIVRTDNTGRQFAKDFYTLPDRKDWPQYYNVIAVPMSLEIINNKISKRYYVNVQQFVEDVQMMLNNALFFNEESSRIWKDAKILNAHFAEIMKEAPPDFVPPRKYNTAKRRAEAEARAAGLPIPSTVKAAKALLAGGTGHQPMDEDGSPGGYGEEAESGDDEYGSEGRYDPNDVYNHANDGSQHINTSVPPIVTEVPDPFAIPRMRSRSGTPPPPLPPPSHVLPSPSRPPPTTDFALTASAQFLPNPALRTVSKPPYSPSPPPQEQHRSPAIGNGFNSIHSYTTVAPMHFGRPVPLNAPPRARLIAKIPFGADVPAISHFTVRTTPDQASIVLNNSFVRQHSFAIPLGVNKVELVPRFRQNQGRGKIKATSDDVSLVIDGQQPTSPTPPTIPTPIQTAPVVDITVRPIQTLIQKGVEPSASPSEAPVVRYILTPTKGLTVVEFIVESEGKNKAEGVVGLATSRPKAEMYRIFLTK